MCRVVGAYALPHRMVADWDCVVRTLVRVEMAGSGPGHDAIFQLGCDALVQPGGDGVGHYDMWRRSAIEMALDEGSGAFGGGVGEDLFGRALFLDAAGVEEDRAR
jgi:hypothetical protein